MVGEDEGEASDSVKGFFNEFWWGDWRTGRLMVEGSDIVICCFVIFFVN